MSAFSLLTAILSNICQIYESNLNIWFSSLKNDGLDQNLSNDTFLQNNWSFFNALVVYNKHRELSMFKSIYSINKCIDVEERERGKREIHLSHKAAHQKCHDWVHTFRASKIHYILSCVVEKHQIEVLLKQMSSRAYLTLLSFFCLIHWLL